MLSLPLLTLLDNVWIKTLLSIGVMELALLLMFLGMVRTSARATQANRRGWVIAFYHPRCTGGGGGERVLWKMIQVLSEHTIPVVVVPAASAAGAAEGRDSNDDKSNNDTAKDIQLEKQQQQQQQPAAAATATTSIIHEPTIEQIIIYTTEEPTATYAQDVYQHVQERFAISLPYETLNLRFVHLDEYRSWLEPAPRWSLLLESWGTLRLAWTALRLTLQSNGLLTVPHVWIDTTGAAFTYLPARLLFGCRVLAYVHYPTISTDMLRNTLFPITTRGRRSSDSEETTYTTTTTTTTPSLYSLVSLCRTIRSLAKCLYYILFAALYGAVGSLSSLVLTNSTWTYHHIQSLWKYAAWRGRVRIVYPPCQTTTTTMTTITTPALNNNNNNNNNMPPPRESNAIVSIGQFRPEKDHALQLEAMARLLKQHPEWKHHQHQCKMVLIGSCRSGPLSQDDTNGDRARLEKLQRLAQVLNIAEHVEFVVNQPFEVVQEWLAKGSVGIHTMWNEHFGIAIVESMAAGQIMVAHNSGGPQSDILIPYQGDKITGFLATTADEYAERIHEILSMSDAEASEVRRNAQLSAQRFSDQVFEESFRHALMDLQLIGGTIPSISTKTTNDKVETTKSNE